MKKIKKYFPSISSYQEKQFNKLKILYEFWNSKINLISKNSLKDINEKHLLHSLSIAKIISFLPNRYIMDAGTGGGFPGLPLAILFPKTNFFLVDSIYKKIKVIIDISKNLELKNTRFFCKRIEDIEYKFDFIISRALAKLSCIVKWTSNNFFNESKHKIPNGLLCLKGGDLNYETKRFPNYKEYFLKNFFDEEYFKSKKILYLPYKIKL